jgi:hypothetical protein
MLMQINGLSAEINLPDAPKGLDIHSLPPYAKQDVYQVDDYAGCPQNWMHGSGKAASFFLPVDTDKHLWLDFNSNWLHSHYVAIVLSVQGINPITGLPTKSLRLEQYRDKCIIHGDEFGADRFCQKCANNVPGEYDGTRVDKFPSKWPPQNYMTTAKHTSGLLWIDGWMADNDTIRGFLITSETMRGIAQQIIGDDRVWAIGIAFYLSKEPKPIPLRPILRTAGISGQSFGFTHNSSPPAVPVAFGKSDISYTANATGKYCCNSIPNSMEIQSYAHNIGNEEFATCPTSELILDQSSLIETEKLEIGAGAKIQQQLCELDPNEPSFYKDKPEGLLYVNYCSKADFDKIMAVGQTDRAKNGEGFLSGLQTGH